MDGLKRYTVSWLDWGANYLKDDPQDFFSRLAVILLPLFALSGAMAYYLLKQIDKDEKRKERKNQVVKRAQKASRKKRKVQ